MRSSPSHIAVEGDHVALATGSNVAFDLIVVEDLDTLATGLDLLELEREVANESSYYTP